MRLALKFLFCGVILVHVSQIINGYLKLLAATHGNCHVIISQTLTSVINRVAVLNKLHLLTKVNDFFCLKNIPLYDYLYMYYMTVCMYICM